MEPRVYTFIEPYGVQISTWYLTNSYATLTLRSRISAEIIEAFNNEPDIQIAYPTKTIRLVSGDDVDRTAVLDAIKKSESDSKDGENLRAP